MKFIITQAIKASLFITTEKKLLFLLKKIYFVLITARYRWVCIYIHAQSGNFKANKKGSSSQILLYSPPEMGLVLDNMFVKLLPEGEHSSPVQVSLVPA